APDRCCGHDIPDHPTVQHKCCSFGEVVVKVSEDQRTPSVFKHFQLVLPAIKTERQTEPAVGCEVHNNICLGEDPPPLPRIYARLSEFVFYG
ncbi:MAG: hypothetical protein JNM00_05875, partial [Flavobacteriales bacterium]|nr:hypothetical protein [Flavobacteriales bacterium]